jgi:hypothetical protein
MCLDSSRFTYTLNVNANHGPKNHGGKQRGSLRRSYHCLSWTVPVQGHGTNWLAVARISGTRTQERLGTKHDVSNPVIGSS